MTQDGKPVVQVLARINSVRGWQEGEVQMVQFDLRSLDKTIRVKPLSVPLEGSEHLKIGTVLAFTVWEATPEEVKAFYER